VNVIEDGDGDPHVLTLLPGHPRDAAVESNDALDVAV
jgi:hypothetical protein